MWLEVIRGILFDIDAVFVSVKQVFIAVDIWACAFIHHGSCKPGFNICTLIKKDIVQDKCSSNGLTCARKFQYQFL